MHKSDCLDLLFFIFTFLKSKKTNTARRSRRCRRATVLSMRFSRGVQGSVVILTMYSLPPPPTPRATNPHLFSNISDTGISLTNSWFRNTRQHGRGLAVRITIGTIYRYWQARVRRALARNKRTPTTVLELFVLKSSYSFLFFVKIFEIFSTKI